MTNDAVNSGLTTVNPWIDLIWPSWTLDWPQNYFSGTVWS